MTLKQMKQEFEKLRKAFEIIKNGKKVRYVEYFPKGWFLIDYDKAGYLGRNWQLAYAKLQTLSVGKRFYNQSLGFYLPPALFCGRNYQKAIKMGFKRSMFEMMVEIRKVDFWDLRPGNNFMQGGVSC